MPEIGDEKLLDLALGLRNDATLRRAVQHSAKLRERLGDITTDLSDLDRELSAVLADAAANQDELRNRPWRILLALDSSLSARRAARAAVALAKASNGEVLVIHAPEVTRSRSGLASRRIGREAGHLTDSVVADLRDQGVSARGVTIPVRVGGIATCLLDVAELSRVDLIVVGSRELSATAGNVIDGVTQKLLQCAPCPVLIVR